MKTEKPTAQPSIKPMAKPSNNWQSEVDLKDGDPYFVAYGDKVYGVTYSNDFRHFVGFNFHERGKPDLIYTCPELPKRV